jgi:hypothetical protein
LTMAAPTGFSVEDNVQLLSQDGSPRLEAYAVVTSVTDGGLTLGLYITRVAHEGEGSSWLVSYA